MVDTPGYCMNTHSCPIAASGAAVKVALEDPFLCPKCGGSLAPPALDKIGSPGRLAVLVAAFACVAIGAGATVLARGGFFIGPPPASELATTLSIAPALLAGPAVLFTQDPLTVPLPETLPAAEAEAPPRAPHKHAPKELAQAGAPALMRAGPGGGRHHANVHMSVSIPLIAGGLPEYPEQYEEDGRSGSVTVACGLQPDGGTTQCRTTSLSGGRIFDVAVHSWLELKDVRFAPPRARRRPPIRNVTLTVQFIGETPDTQ